jgi:hypothetical protein
MSGWERLVRTGDPGRDAHEVQRLAVEAQGKGLAIHAVPVPGGGVHVRAYAPARGAWGAPPEGQAPGPISSRFAAPIAPPRHGPQPAAAWGQPGWGTPQPAVAPVAPARPPSATLQAPVQPAGTLGQPGGIDRFRATHVLAVQGGIDAIQSDLAALGYADRATEAARSKWGWITGLGCAGVVLLAVGGFLFPPFFVVVVIALGLWALALRTYGSHKKADLENARLLLAHRLLQLIEVDVDPTHPVLLRLCLSGHDERSKIRSFRKMEVPGGVGSWDETVYQDDWLHLTARTADGSRLRLVFFEVVRERKGWKRGRAGKVKSKKKLQVRSTVVLDVGVKPSRHAALMALRETGWRAVRLPVGAQARDLTVTPEGLSMKVNARGPWAVATRDATGRPTSLYGATKSFGGVPPGMPIDALDTAAMMLLSAFQILNFSSKASRARAS